MRSKLMNKFRFCESFVYMNGQPLSFAGRPYLRNIYAVDRGNLVIRASRQVEKSTFLANTIIHAACCDANAQILLVLPRDEQASMFSSVRLLPAIQNSPVLRRRLLGRGSKIQVTNLQFSNGARLWIRAAYHSADSSRGISANLLLVDEFQDIASGNLPVLQETLSHATHGRTILTGTPKSVDNHLEAMFNLSTANCWLIPCSRCGHDVTLDERCLGATGLVCPKCDAGVNCSEGRWVAGNPTATWGQGYSISHPMVPWLNHDDILEKQRSYDPVRFRNEVMGLPTSIGELLVTRAELEECCTGPAMTRPGEAGSRWRNQRLFAGLDWGGGERSRTLLTIGYMGDDYRFHVVFMEAFHAREEPGRILTEVANRCNAFGIVGIAADGRGNGNMFNRQLSPLIRVPLGFYAIIYSTVDHPPQPDGVLTKWTVDRTSSIGVLFTRIKTKKLVFPAQPDMHAFLDEFACETASYDDKMRRTKYTHPETQNDDALHATNYALLLATHAFNAASRYY